MSKIIVLNGGRADFYMFINFDEVAILKSIGIDYFSHNKPNMTNMNESEYAELYNQWLPYEGRDEADIRCQIVHIGKKLEGNASRLRIAVYHTENRMDTLMLFPISAINTAIQCMYAESGRGEIVCVE